MTDVEEPAPEPEPTAAPRRRGRASRAVAFVAAVAAVALAVLWRSEVSDSTDLQDERDDRRDVEEIAAAFGEAYLTYDFDDEATSGDAVIELASDAFAEDFEATRAPGIEQLFADLQTTTRATAKEVFLGSVGERRARALVVVDVEATSSASGDQQLTNLSFVLDLVREDGEWRVDSVAPAPQPDIADGGTDDGAADEGSTDTTGTTDTTVGPTTTAP